MDQAAPLRIFTLKRTHKRALGVFGVLDDEGEPFALTLENHALYIPEGEYVCRKRHYIRGNYDTYEIMNVTNRTDILLHKGNLDSDSAGCVLLGENFGLLKGRTGILDSAGGFQEFMARTHDADSFKLVILEWGK